MTVKDFTNFLKLSSVINYNLSATSLNRYNLLMYIIADKRLHPDEQNDREQKGIVMEALNFLLGAYRQKRRRLGPMAVLHPLRATALYADVCDQLHLAELLAMMFHDVLEDIKAGDFDAADWKRLESQFYSLISRLDVKDEDRLIEHLTCLTRRAHESYYEYVGRLLSCPSDPCETVQIKLADRLDNTLDMRIDLQDPLEGIDFFRNIFQALYVGNYKGYMPAHEHSASASLNGAKRLYQLFKNAVLLSLIRQKIGESSCYGLQVLFDEVAEASLQEAQRTLLHLTGYHVTDLEQQRRLLLDAMAYCYSGRSDLVTLPGANHPLDGLFSGYFGPNVKSTLQQQLDRLYQDKPLMLQASLAFIVIFLSFRNDTGYYIEGITAAGIQPR